MIKMKNLIMLQLSLIVLSCSSVAKKDVNYDVAGVNHIGHIASGAKKGEKKPGVIIVHEWWGHNEYARSRAKMLADLGYVAMSIDMYGEGKQAKHPKDAGAFAKKAMSDMKLAKKKFTTALELLKNRPDVDPEKIAAIGYCFGGAVVLNMARAGVDLDLVASFHGSLTSKMKAKKSSFKPAHVMVFNGAKDPMITQEHIDQFDKEMKAIGVEYTFENYANALHAFTNKEADYFGKKFQLPLAYDEKADQDSWKKFTQALERL
jgi:dienelactone hydrolase